MMQVINKGYPKPYNIAIFVYLTGLQTNLMQIIYLSVQEYDKG